MNGNHIVEWKLHIEKLFWSKVSGVKSFVLIIVVFAKKKTVHGASLIFLGHCFEIPVRFWCKNIDFMKLPYGWSKWQFNISHEMWFFFKWAVDDWIRGQSNYFFFGDFCASALMISIVLKCNGFWYFSLDYVSTTIYYPLFVVIFNNISASVLIFLNWF